MQTTRGILEQGGSEGGCEGGTVYEGKLGVEG